MLNRSCRLAAKLKYTVRVFSSKLGAGMAEEYGQKINDDFLPDRETLELDTREMDEATISLKGTDILRHKEEFDGTIYKYDLPVQNSPIVFKRDAALALLEEEIDFTPVQKLME
jgi:hypothetical protein